MKKLTQHAVVALAGIIFYGTAGAQADAERRPPPQSQQDWNQPLWLEDQSVELHDDYRVQRNPDKWRQPRRQQGRQSVYLDARVVRRPPVAPRIMRAPRPTPRHTWVAGEYIWRGGRYFFAPGAWIVPPVRGMHYVPGRWQPVRGGFVWIAGFWAGGPQPRWR